MNNGIIYKITSPSNKIYIGQTINFEKRISKYKNLHCKKQRKLYNSFIKYGFENHKIQIIERDVNNMEDLNFLEEFWIKYFNCFDTEYGLNLRSGGENSLHSKETKRKISEANKGKNQSEETKRKISKNLKGKTKPEKTREKMSEAKKGEKHPMSKNCYVLDIENKIIYKFETANLAANFFNYKQPNISNICLGKNKTFLNKKYTAAYNLQEFIDRGYIHNLEEIFIIKESYGNSY